MKVGFIGLGRMGKPMAANVARAGFDLMVHDLNPEPLEEIARLGARIARSAGEVAEGAELIEVAVVDDAQVNAVVGGEAGLIRAARAGSVIAVHSTVSPRTVVELAARAQSRDVFLLDATVSGGEKGAEERNLCYMVGGEKEAFERCRAVFSTSGSHIFHTGRVGTGATAKMILQVVVCLNMLGAYEAEALARKTGLDFRSVQQILHVGSAQSFVLDHWLDRFKRAGDPDPVRRRRTEVFRKSLAPALELAEEMDLSLPGAALAQELLDRIMGIEEPEPRS